MNERDKGLAKQAWTENDWDAYVDVAKLIQLVRADEREACAEVCAALMESPELIGDCHVCVDAIQARGNT